ncbi:hypothetical protein P3T35_007874 [Kitasatospora sp. GP30]|nr:hypothetical protein [Kitasatospora sp. GP30]
MTIHDLGETGPADSRVPFLVMDLGDPDEK